MNAVPVERNASQVRQAHVRQMLVALALVLVLAFTSLPLIGSQGINPHDSLAAFTSFLDKRIPQQMKTDGIPGVSVALVQNGQLAWSSAYGFADVAQGRRMTADTACRVESISKSVTAWGVMKLVEQGRVDLDKPVQSYLKSWSFPPSAYASNQITVRQLLTHTAGLPLGGIFDRYPPTGNVPPLRETLTRQAVPMQAPGISYAYSNVGYDVLEVLIEDVTGRSFAEYMEKEILVPLGMRQSSFSWRGDLQPAIPVGYDLKGSPVPEYIYPAKASGGLIAPVEDIAAFVAAGMPALSGVKSNGSISPSNVLSSRTGVLSSQGIAALHAPTVTQIGVYSMVFDAYTMGYYRETLSGNRIAIANGGQGGGVMTHLHYVPETGDGLVILTNSQRSWPFIATILREWSTWNGFGQIGMAKLIWAQTALWGLIVLIFILSAWIVWRLASRLMSRTARFSPLARPGRFKRVLQAVASVAILLVLLWSILQDYLFLSSVFPIASDWLGLAALALAMALLASSMFPRHT